MAEEQAPAKLRLAIKGRPLNFAPVDSETVFHNCYFLNSAKGPAAGHQILKVHASFSPPRLRFARVP